MTHANEMMGWLPLPTMSKVAYKQMTLCRDLENSVSKLTKGVLVLPKKNLMLKSFGALSRMPFCSSLLDENDISQKKRKHQKVKYFRIQCFH